MPVFVHLAPERALRSIRRSGIVPPRVRFGPRGVFALPVTHNFYVSHQWLRELRRWGSGTIVGVYFRLPGDEPVEVGHYNRGRVPMTAAQAAGLLFDAEARDPARARADDERSKAVQRGKALPTSAEGYEVFIPRAIHPSEILRVKALPQVVGWRYWPGANGRPPCTCICCERGRYGFRKLLGKVEEAEALGRPTKIVMGGRDAASDRRVERLRRKRGE
jgi:hypothetical protein